MENTTDSNSRKQYRDFIQGLLAGGLLTFFKEYPVLARLAATAIDSWVEVNGEFLSRLASDRCEIQKTFHDEIELGKVVTVQSNLSDRHHNGRSVIIVEFASGLKLVYKPKSLNLEQSYIKLLAWLNKHKIPLPFKLFKVINRSTYGWVEFVETLPCSDEKEVKRYYKRAGILLCLAYILEATDLHFENLIACGEYPMLIDLETLMHPREQEIEKLDASENAQILANQQMWHSVIRTGLLPRWQFGSKKWSYDSTGFGGGGQNQLPFPLQKWNNINKDNMSLVYGHETIQPSANLPSVNGVDIEFNNYQEEIIGNRSEEV
jgi:type 2 lantibiotic biosynthesis protein LanM